MIDGIGMDRQVNKQASKSSCVFIFFGENYSLRLILLRISYTSILYYFIYIAHGFITLFSPLFFSFILSPLSFLINKISLRLPISAQTGAFLFTSLHSQFLTVRCQNFVVIRKLVSGFRWLLEVFFLVIGNFGT